MDSTKVKVILFIHKIYSDGASPIMIRITKNRKSRYISTGYAVKEENWDEENNQVIETKRRDQVEKKPFPNARAINNDIEIKVNEVIGIKQKLSMKDNMSSAKKIKEEVASASDQDFSFLKYAQKRIQQLEEGQQFRTYKRYKSITKQLEKYRRGKDLSFNELTVELINDFELYLKKRNYHPNTIYTTFKTVRAIINTAIREGKFSPEKDPFIRIKLKTVKTNKEKLTIEELNKIELLDLEPNTPLWHTRNYFMFSFYNAGIRAGDLIQLKWENIRDGRLFYQMAKTDHFKSIRLQDQALSILKHYRKKNSKPSDYIFSLLDNEIDYSSKRVLYNNISSRNAVINKNLKKIAEDAEIEKPLSFHIARHSFSDLARKRGANIYDISKALGHSNTKITETYLANFDEESLDQTMNKIFQQ
jgi:integrase/recombinase XerD